MTAIIRALTKTFPARSNIVCNTTGLTRTAINISRGAIVPSILVFVRPLPSFLSTAVRQQSAQGDRSLQQQDIPIVGLDQYHVDDVMNSIKYIEAVLENLKTTQERQRKLFHKEADTLVPAGNSRMGILFQEASLQQSIILKCLNNIKVNLYDAEKPSTTIRHER